VKPRTAAVAAIAVIAATGLGAYLAFAPGAKQRQVPELQFLDSAARPRSLSEFRGRTVLLNVWATWCAPCRMEMPALDRLQTKLGGADFQVLALSIDQQGAEIVRKFFAETGIKALELYIDPSARAPFLLGASALPMTLLIDREGREIGRRAGPAEWDAARSVDELRRPVTK